MSPVYVVYTCPGGGDRCAPASSPLSGPAFDEKKESTVVIGLDGFSNVPSCVIVRLAKVALVIPIKSEIPTGPVVINAMTTCSSAAGVS